jgi:hypothetical protein
MYHIRSCSGNDLQMRGFTVRPSNPSMTPRSQRKHNLEARPGVLLVSLYARVMLSEVAYSSASTMLHVRGDQCMVSRSRGAKKAWTASRDKKVAKAREKKKDRKAALV